MHLHMRLFPKESCLKLGVDYAYLGPEGSQVTILVCKCKRTGCLAATQVLEKGVNVYVLAFFTGWLRGSGWKRLLLRSDNERALLAFLRAAKRQLDWSEPLATWLVANCLSRYRIQTDGKTPDQRRTGKRWRRQADEFGEKAAFLPVAAP